MKDQLNLWLSQRARLSGVRACGVRYPDRSTFTQQWAEGFAADSLEKSLAGMSDLWRLLRLNGINGQWLRWGYSHCWFYAALRTDGTLLGLIAERSETVSNSNDVADLLHEFFERFPSQTSAQQPNQ